MKIRPRAKGRNQSRNRNRLTVKNNRVKSTPASKGEPNSLEVLGEAIAMLIKIQQREPAPRRKHGSKHQDPSTRISSNLQFGGNYLEKARALHSWACMAGQVTPLYRPIRWTLPRSSHGYCMYWSTAIYRAQEQAAKISRSISSDASTPSDLATVNCSGLALAATSTESEVKVVMNAPFPMELACRLQPRKGGLARIKAPSLCRDPSFDLHLRTRTPACCAYGVIDTLFDSELLTNFCTAKSSVFHNQVPPRSQPEKKTPLLLNFMALSRQPVRFVQPMKRRV